MYRLLIDENTVLVTERSELIVHEINKTLAPFRRYGGLNFVVEGSTMKARYGSMTTNVTVECDSDYHAQVFKTHHPDNF